MALFGKKTAGKKNDTSVLKRVEPSADRDLAGVLIRPRITEKAVMQTDRGVYTFLVRRSATKYDVRDAVIHLFQVTPRKVAMVNRAPRQTHSRARGRTVTESGMKKAIVFLKKGDRIDLI